MTWAIENKGYLHLVSDNGTELTLNVILAWQADRQVEWHYISKPIQNGCVESVNGRLHDERPNERLSPAIGTPIEQRRIDYNVNRPHTSLRGSPHLSM